MAPSSLSLDVVAASLADLPVAQAVWGAILGSHAIGADTKVANGLVGTAARCATQGLSAPPSAPTDALSDCDSVLIAMRDVMGVDTIPAVDEAKAWLMRAGGTCTARALGRLSSLRNTQAHSLAQRVLADARRLASKTKAGRPHDGELQAGKAGNDTTTGTTGSDNGGGSLDSTSVVKPLDVTEVDATSLVFELGADDVHAGGFTVRTYTPDAVGTETLVGDYAQEGVFHGRPFYKKVQEIPGCEDVKVFLYYFGTGEGSDCAGWFFGDQVGGSSVWARADAHAKTPPRTGWKIPWDLEEDVAGYIILDHSCAKQ